MDIVKRYQQLNNSYKKTLVFNLGSEAGFYSEFNNMIFGILYCLKNEYKFVLYSDDANFKLENGWDDYFVPFCDETKSFIHRIYNRRFEKPSISLKNKVYLSIFKLFNKNVHFTYQLFYKFFNAEFEREYFSFPDLGIEGDLKTAASEMLKIVYRFNKETDVEMEKLIKSIELPQKYVSLHIRRGDKVTEWNFANLSEYMDKLNATCNLKDVFISTDDFDVVIELRQMYKDFKFYTLSQEDDKGYKHGKHNSLNNSQRKADFVKLFASIEVMCSSQLVIGTYTSNIGLFIGMRMDSNKFISVQKASWYQFEYEDVKQFLIDPDFLNNV